MALAAQKHPAPPVASGGPWDLARAPRVPVARPQLAPVEAALPYLRQVDDARTYSNYGPLNARFEARLAERFGLPAECVVTCANGTVGLTLALLAATGGRVGLCLMPSWTFTATAHAATAAGLTPFLVDIDGTSGALTPEIAQAALARAPRDVAAVMPVSPYGLPLDIAAWDRFAGRTGVPVVVDAAAGFDGLVPGEAAAAVSLHATKVLGLGEGGFVVSRNVGLIADLRARANFGFAGRRESSTVGLNGKLSEYGAAFGLAALDLWPVQRPRWLSLLGYYRAALGHLLAEGLGETWVGSTACITTEAAAEIEQRLTQRGIATRRWWGEGVHAQPAFAQAPRLALPATERLAATTLGLPCYPDIEVAALEETTSVVLGAL